MEELVTKVLLGIEVEMYLCGIERILGIVRSPKFLVIREEKEGVEFLEILVVYCDVEERWGLGNKKGLSLLWPMEGVVVMRVIP